ncbi:MULTISPECIES: LytR/AlgR family response regulator transcription factor [Zunongwangia]|uniref:LytTR family two component transcriptional regulator n=2 Tax=Zunongwangia TaxID=417127 RepID=A0A1Y1T2A0_9FLAO|nr:MULTISPECIES: LytTR family DNA-binding domain-containing protein [Zunongwangia]MCL6219941.1 LytTR family DNA-binding domain-containing protein [Zunongwangia pacifica]ORL44922.1 LytTR family two component transcriptional regulator [Zunongwangia atlantica 22II14-10F7]WBL25734.1 LytTR family DNA-binding domain-containing protein [Zunongwangia sp. HGR-M22]
MKVVIIEDEDLAADSLESLLLKSKYDITIAARLENIKQAKEWFANHSCDLIFSDISLGDGESFEIFNALNIKIPIIFTTAFDHFAVQSFQFFAIDYLLKPYNRQKLDKALEKYMNFVGDKRESDKVESLLERIQTTLPDFQSPKIQNRFLVSQGEELISIKSEEIAYFMAENKSLFLFTREHQVYLYDSTISNLEDKLAPKEFFKINRKFIISHNAIKSIVKYSQNRLKIELNPSPGSNDPILISSMNINAFKEWLNH